MAAFVEDGGGQGGRPGSGVGDFMSGRHCYAFLLSSRVEDLELKLDEIGDILLVVPCL